MPSVKVVEEIAVRPLTQCVSGHCWPVVNARFARASLQPGYHAALWAHLTGATYTRRFSTVWSRPERSILKAANGHFN